MIHCFYVTVCILFFFLSICLQSGVLSSIRHTPTHLIIISWKDGIYKTVAGAGDPDDKKEVRTTYIAT